MKRLIVFALAFLPLAACGSSTPSSPTPTEAQIAGVWGGNETLTSASGGECVGAYYLANLGATSPVTASIQQTASNLTATVTDPGTGASCTYSGSVGTSTVTMNLTSCTLGVFSRFVCANGALRDYQIQTGSFSGTVSGTTITGTAATTYNVYISGTNIGVGPLVVNASARLTKQ